MKGLDLRKFKKLHSTEHVTTLVHPDGHKISIAHNKVKPELAEQMKNLPKFSDGGWVDSVVKTVKESFEDAPKPKSTPAPQAPSQEDAKKMQKVFGDTTNKYAKGGMVARHYYEGTDAGPVGSDADNQQQDPFQSMVSAPSVEPMSSSMTQGQSDSIPDTTPVTVDTSMTNAAQQQSNGLLEQSKIQSQQDLNKPNKLNYDNYGKDKPEVQPQMPKMDTSGTQDQILGIGNEAIDTGKLGTREASIEHNRQLSMQDVQKTYADNVAGIQKEIEAVTHDLKNGHIDPQHFWNSKSDMGKISSAIGLILGGIGGGLTHQENPALKFLNAQIDRDIEGQKMQMNNQHNLLSALNSQLGNMKDAALMAKAMYADVYASKIAEAADASKDPIAKDRALQAIGQIKAAQQPITNMLALKESGKQALAAGADPALVVPMMNIPKEQLNTVYTEVKQSQNMKMNEAAILQNFANAKEENTILRRGFGHLGAEPAALTNIRNLLMPVLKDNEGRINETEIKMMEDFLPKAGDRDNKIEQKLQGLKAFIEAKKSAPTAKSFGIDLNKSTYMMKPSGNAKDRE